ncbi:endolytic transglycosylase MltG [Hydrogenimonas sp.]
MNGIDRRLLPLFGYPQRGWIDIGRTKLTKADFLYRLTHAKAAMTRVTLIPGETRVLFFDQLSEKLGLDREKLEKAYRLYAPFPEGVIWPDTYYIPIGITEKDLIYYLVGRSMRRHRRLAEKFFGIYDEKKWFRYVTIASIVQKEAADESEMPIVSAVIYNRIKRGMPLQMDGALNYGKYSHVKVTRKRIEEDRSRFNTYKFAGLPPYPVGSVSLEAIKAAVKPADVDYLYFVKGREGKHLFTKRYKTHLRNIKSVNK